MPGHRVASTTRPSIARLDVAETEYVNGTSVPLSLPGCRGAAERDPIGVHVAFQFFRPEHDSLCGRRSGSSIGRRAAC